MSQFTDFQHQLWFRAPEGAAVTLTYRACGGRFAAVMTCDQCTQPLHGNQVAAR